MNEQKEEISRKSKNIPIDWAGEIPRFIPILLAISVKHIL
jgi:hypothetical protein